MPISRDRDCCGLTEISGISGGRQSFGRRMVLDHFDHGGPVQTAGSLREESQPIKNRALGNHSPLGNYMYEIQHISKEENMLISGTREESAVADSAEPKQ
jgi:hypothetical protein